MPRTQPPPDRFPKSPGQHEELIERVRDIQSSLDKLKEIRVVVEIDTTTSKDILKVVLDIQKILKNDLANRATVEEVNAILGPVLEKLKQVHS